LLLMLKAANHCCSRNVLDKVRHALLLLLLIRGPRQDLEVRLEASRGRPVAKEHVPWKKKKKTKTKRGGAVAIRIRS